MTKDNCISNRTRLVDSPIVEMLLLKKYGSSGIQFMRPDGSNDCDCTDIICYSSGTKRNLNIKRNSSKYYNSPNFSLSVNKNRLGGYIGTSFVFIDEVANCLYIIDGLELLSYMLEHADNVKQSDSGGYFIIVPKKDLLSIIENNTSRIIKYNKSVANLFAAGRDESQFIGLV